MASLATPLSLKHICCHMISGKLWKLVVIRASDWIRDTDWKPDYKLCHIYADHKPYMMLRDSLSSLELPESLQKELLDVSVSLGQTLCNISYCYDTKLKEMSDTWYKIGHTDDQPLFAHPHLYDSLVFSPSSVGDVIAEQMILNLLRDSRIPNSMKYFLARHFYIHDPEIADNLELYCEKLVYSDEAELEMVHKSLYYVKSFRRALACKNLWALMHYWNKMSYEERLSVGANIDEVLELLQMGTFRQDMSMSIRQYHVLKFLCNKLDNEDNWLTLLSLPIVDSFFTYYCDPFCSNETDWFLELLEKALPEVEFYEVITSLVRNIVVNNKRFLYPSFLLVWNRRSDSFKEDLRSHFETCMELLYLHGHINIEFTRKFLLHLLPYLPQMKPNLSLECIGGAAVSLLNWKSDLQPLDEYLQSFVCSSRHIEILKRSAVESHLRQFFTRENRAKAYMISRWVLGMEQNVEDYFNAMRSDIL